VDQAQDVETYRSAVLGKLGGAFDGMVESMFSDILGSVPAFQERTSPAELNDVRSALRRGGGFFLRCLVENRRLDADEIVALQVIGAQRARYGLSRDGLTAAVEAAMRTGYRRLVEAALEVPASTEAAVRGMASLSLRLFDFVQDATTALLTGYLDEEAQRITSRVRQQSKLVDRLLEASWTDEDEIRAHAKGLGLDIEPPFALLLVVNDMPHEAGRLRAAATALATAVDGAVEGPTRSAPVPHVVVLVTSVPKGWRDIVTAADGAAAAHDVYVACVEPVGDVRSVCAAYRRVQRDLGFVPAARSGPGAVATKDVKAYRILACAPLEDRLDFVQQALGPIFDLSETKAVELLDTVESLYDNRGQVPAVATELGIHEKTVRYRLRRVQELTGLGVDVPGDRLQLDMAVRLRRLAMAEVRPFDDPAWGPPSARGR
jgi:DNA-binding PucR family transcriptional regulator